MISFVWLFLFKVHRKLYRIASPFLCRIYSFSNSVRVKKSLFIGFPFLAGNITIEEGAVLISLLNGNELGITKPCRIIARKGIITIGSNFQASGVSIFSNTSVSIGDNVMIGANSVIIDDDMHPLPYAVRMEYPSDSISKPILIGDNVWIGSNVTILKGVKVGARSVIGSGVVLRSDVPPDTVAYNSNSMIRLKSINM